MKKRLIRNRKARYGAVAVLLTVLTVAVTILANAVVSTLAERYLWYSVMVGDERYDVTDDCYALTEEIFRRYPDESGNPAAVRIIFCNEEEKLMKEDVTRFLYITATELAERFPNITIDCFDIVTDPTSVKKYRETVNPLTGETMIGTLNSSSVIITCGDRHRVYQMADFYVFEDGDTDKLWAYNGEKKLVAALLHVVDRGEHMVCLLSNHGESFNDYELRYLLDEAGYTIAEIDLFKDPIPASCELMISFNPNSDLLSDEISSFSETEVLDEFLSVKGHSLMVFLNNTTPNLPNFEKYLAGWGVSCNYTGDAASGYRWIVRDDNRSLTSDGYTIYGKAADGEGAKLLEGLDRNVIFKKATSMRVSNEGYVDAGNGSYRSLSGERVMIPLYRGASGSAAWANGTMVGDGETSILMSLTEQTVPDGKSHVAVVASTGFSSEDLLQSAVYGNNDVLLRLFRIGGKEMTPEGLTIKPFAAGDISDVTTAAMLRWTLILALTPAIVITALALVVLIRRRRA